MSFFLHPADHSSRGVLPSLVVSECGRETSIMRRLSRHGRGGGGRG